jgi:hypothetical protein
MLSAMEYPHWMIVAGAVLVVLGFIGVAFRQNIEPDHEPTEMKASDGRDSNVATLPPWPWRPPPEARGPGV